MKKKVASVDFLRAISILGVIAIHTLSFSLTNGVNIFFWNFLQFIVAIFIFCSGYVHGNYVDRLVSFPLVFSWYKKRFVRILFPFFIYFFIHLSLFFLFPNFFTHFGLQKNIAYIFSSLFLFGGINTNWLPLLFLQLMLLTPIFFFLQRKHTLWIYVIGILSVTLFGTISFFPYSSYRMLMWVGWSLVFLMGLFASKQRNAKKIFTIVGIVSSLVFIVLFFVWMILHRSLNFIDNKYPPNLYYLTYAITGTIIAFIFSKKIVISIPSWIYVYISKKSYSLFFIHYIVLDFLLGVHLIRSVVLLFVLTSSLSIGVSLLLDIGFTLLTSKILLHSKQ